MTQFTKPNLPIPNPIKGSEIGTFAHHSVIVRLPDIGRRVIAENDFPPDIVARLEALIAEIPDGLIRPLTDPHAPDTANWNQYIAAYPDHNWLQLPWFFAETYFYRRVLATTGYFRPGHNMDPYAYQKRRGLETTRASIRALSTQLDGWLKQGWHGELFGRLLMIDLWGNQADLSIWAADAEDQPGHADDQQQMAHILVNDTTAVTSHLSHANEPVRVDFMIDNAGFELVCDLCLADYLLSSEMAATVQFNLKLHPTFVSDAMISDVAQTVGFLAEDDHVDVRALAGRLKGCLGNGRLQLRQHPFWTSPLDAWLMPPDLRQELTHSHLVISKGDANYRRLLGDRHWPFTTLFADVVSCFPAPLVALRTLKSELVVGLQPGQSETLDQKDPQWLKNAHWGIIQFVNPEND